MFFARARSLPAPGLTLRCGLAEVLGLWLAEILWLSLNRALPLRCLVGVTLFRGALGSLRHESAPTRPVFRRRP